MVQLVETTLHVDPQQGDNRATGEASTPVKTISQALRLAIAGTVIRLSEGQYTAESGEEFPLRVPAGVTLIGNVNRRAAIAIIGGGAIDSPTFGQQTVTLVLEAAAQLRGITVTNPLPQGTGIWIEFDQPAGSTIAHCTVLDCEREGIFVSGVATPTIANCLLQANRASGIAFVRYAKGEVRRCTILESRFGMVISDRSAPLLIDTQISQNQTGILVSGNARPVLRHNAIVQNHQKGLAISGAAQPNLGTPQDPASNRFQENGAIDLHNHTAAALDTVGNQLNPLRVKGSVNFLRVVSAVLPCTPTIAAALPILFDSWLPAIATGRVEPSHSDLTRSQFIEQMLRALPVPLADAAQTDRPDLPLTRLDAIALLTQHLRLATGNLALLDVYRDRAQIPSHIAPRVAAATQHQLAVLASPRENRLQPLQPIRQAEATAMLNQALAMPDSTNFASVRASPANVAFGDIQNHWAADFIRAVASWGAIAGDESGNFSPDQPLSSLEYAQLLTRIFGKFSDASESLDRERSPQPISRLQVWQLLLAELRSRGLEFPIVDLTLLDRYEDAAELSDVAQAAIALATQLQMVFNFPQLQQLRPNHPTTRAEAAAIAYQGVVYLNRKNRPNGDLACPYLIDPDRSDQPQPRIPNAPQIVLLDLAQADLVSPKPISLINQPELSQTAPQSSLQAIAESVTTLLQAQDIEVRSPQNVTAQDVTAQVSLTVLSPNLPDRAGIAVFYLAGSTVSARLAQVLHKVVLRSLDLPNQGVHANETGNLPSIPTVRIEIGTPTYSIDRFDPAFCEAMGQAIGSAICQFLDAND